MDATRPTSTICNSPSLSASASLCCYGTSSRDQDCTNITSLPSTNTDEARFNFFLCMSHFRMLLARISSESGLCSLEWSSTNAWMGTPESSCFQLLLLARGTSKYFWPPSFPSSCFLLPSLFWQRLLLQKCQCPAYTGDSLANSAQITRDSPSRSGKPSLYESFGPSWKPTPSICKGAGGKVRGHEPQSLSPGTEINQDPLC